MTDSQYTLIQSILSNDILMTALLGAVGVAASVVAGWAVYVYRRYVKHQLSDSDAAMVERLAGIAAKWVEQTATPGTPAHERLHQACTFVATQAKARGIDVDETFITAAVEAAVLGLGQPLPMELVSAA